MWFKNIKSKLEWEVVDEDLIKRLSKDKEYEKIDKKVKKEEKTEKVKKEEKKD